ncbi:MAG: hypothetical protein AB8E82_03920 [Aureispira sp.]
MDLTLIDPSELALITACLLFLTALLTGVWKYADMMKSPDRKAHRYIDTTHYASFFYTFACLFLAKLAELSALSAQWNYIAIGTLCTFFVGTIIKYAWLGYRKETNNQFDTKNKTVHILMYLLIVAEIGGFMILFWGFMKGVFLS